MSLVVEIRVNDGPLLELVTARRIAGGELPDDENLYLVERLDRRDGLLRKRQDTTVVHRYGDGAAVLARRALEALT